MIELKRISKFYNNNNNINMALNEVSLTLPDVGLVGIVGENGSGKTTLLNILCGIEDYDSGDYFYNGVDMSLSDSKKLLDNFSIINQDNRLFENLTVYENLKLSMSNKEQNIFNLLDKVHLALKKDEKLINLSAGEIKRIAIIRCLLIDSKVILCDEPTANLDSENAKIIISLLAEISKTHLVIVVTHKDNDFSDFLVKKIMINHGQIEKEEILSNVKEVTTSHIHDDIINDKKLIYKSLRLLRNNFISIILILLMTSILTTYAVIINKISISFTDISIDSSMIYNCDPSRIIIDGGNSSIKVSDELKEIMDDNYYSYNDYIFDTSFNINNEFEYNTDSSYIDKYEFYISFNLCYDYEIIKGTLPKNNNEVFILGDFSYEISESSYFAYKLVGSTFNLKDSDIEYKISGVGQIKKDNKNVETDKCMMYFLSECNDIIDYLLLSKNTYLYSKFLGNKYYVNYLDSMEDDVINLPKNSKCYFNNVEVDLSNYSIINTTNNNYYVYMNKRTYLKIVKSLNYRLSIFFDNPNDIDLNDDIFSGYDVFYPYDNLIVSSMLNSNLMILYAIYISYVIIVVLFIILFIFIRKKCLNKTRVYMSILKMIKVKNKDIRYTYYISSFIDMLLISFICIIIYFVSNVFIKNNLLLLLFVFIIVPLIDFYFINIEIKKTVNELYYNEVSHD